MINIKREKDEKIEGSAFDLDCFEICIIYKIRHALARHFKSQVSQTD